MNKDKCSSGAFMAGIAAGAIIGAGLALLYAPQSGEETRKQIKKKAEEVKNKAIEAKKETLAKMEKMKATAKERAEDVKKRARRAAREFKKEEK